ncbi:MAG: DNA repair protein RadC [Gammaproteobacteria bacterium]
MKISDWPESERPRERLFAKGAGQLSDSELLAVLIGSGRRGISAVDVARDLIGEFGSLREFLCADRRRCMAQLGIGPARYASLQAALELARRHFGHAIRSESALTAPADMRSFVLTELRDKPYEVFCCLYLDVHHRLISFQELFRGTTDGASVYPKEVVREVISRNAYAVIFAHNHPSGTAEPSQADKLVTRRLRDALALIEVKVLDHLVVGETRCVSFADRGLI